jgi:hypothetical protein
MGTHGVLTGYSRGTHGVLKGTGDAAGIRQVSVLTGNRGTHGVLTDTEDAAGMLQVSRSSVPPAVD